MWPFVACVCNVGWQGTGLRSQKFRKVWVLQVPFGVNFGRLVRKKRGIEGLSQQDLAALAFGNVGGKAKISQIENGRIHSPHQKTIDSLVIALEISDAELSECYAPIKLDEHEPIQGPFFHPVDPQIFCDKISGRRLQFALDVANRVELKKFALIAAKENVDFLEIGDPVFQKYGMGIIRDVKNYAPGIPIVAEFASSDWIEQQIQLAANSGADIVQVIGLSNEKRISRAIDSARKHKVGISVAILSHENIAKLMAESEAYGADMVAIIRNLDSSNIFIDIMEILKSLPADFTIPLAISGGFTATQVALALDQRWNVVIVGSSILNSPTPADTIRRIKRILRT